MNEMNDRNRFIILTDQRSGSNHLAGLLDSHRSVRVAGELFNPDRHHLDRSHELLEGLGDLRSRDPVAYLEAFYTQPLDDSTTHLGFRLFHDHARQRPEKAIWTALRRMRNLKVIHLQRRNILKNLLSLKLALRSSRWQRLEGTPPVRYEPLTLTFEEVVAHIKSRERSFARGSRFFRRHRRTEIFYEDLERDEERRLEALLRFLGLPSQPLVSSTRKQNQQPSWELIENHAELEDRFRHTRWHEFFQD
jgi:LPS sulfotransferase NodH